MAFNLNWGYPPSSQISKGISKGGHVFTNRAFMGIWAAHPPWLVVTLQEIASLIWGIMKPTIAPKKKNI